MTAHDSSTGRPGDPAGPSLISSTRNARVVELARLSRRREREASGRFLVEGPNAVGEALADGVVEAVFAVADRVADWQGHGVEVVEVSEPVLERLADSRQPQGVVAVARRQPAGLDAVLGKPLVVVLCDVSDPGNLGTIIRTADAAGADGVVVAGDACDPWNPKAVRATAGSLTHLPIVLAADAAAAVRACRGSGQRALGLDMHGTRDVATLAGDATPVALVFGSEAHGLPTDVRDELDELVAVPTYGRAESLNLAAAAAVAIYAAARGRQAEASR